MITTPLFCTPVFTEVFEDYKELNAGIHNELMNGQQHSNMFDTPGKCIATLHDRVWNITKDISQKYNWFYPPKKVTARYNTIEPNMCDTPHNHPGSSLAGVYYFHTPEKSGDILLHDQRSCCTWENLNYEPNDPQKQKTARTYHRIKPQEGLLIMFPGFLQHSVETNLSNQNRISIVFNVF